MVKNDDEQLQILADDLTNLIAADMISIGDLTNLVNGIQPAEDITFVSAEQGSNYDVT